VSARALTPRLDALKPYGVAVATVGLALPVAQALWPSIRPTVSPVFLAAVMVAAWFGGLRGGLLATVLASLLMDYFSHRAAARRGGEAGGRGAPLRRPPGPRRRPRDQQPAGDDPG